MLLFFGGITARVTLIAADGSQVKHFLKDSAVLTENEQGEWEVNYFDEAAEELVDYATVNMKDGGSQTIQKAQRNISGTEGDDIIILLPSKTQHGVIWDVDAGNGNNIVVDLAGEQSKIKTGNGNDQIIAKGTNGTLNGNYAINSGGGNDSIDVVGMVADIDAGDGDDAITVNAHIGGNKISGGKGNDNIQINANSYGTISGDEGDDTINISGNIHGVNIYGGSADDKASGNDIINVAGDFFRGTINAGNGNNTIYVASAFESKIFSGNGNDVITVDVAHNTTLESGEGDDAINVRYASGSTIMGGDGSNSINVEQAVDSKIFGNDNPKTQSKKTEDTKDEEEELSEYEQELAEKAIGVAINDDIAPAAQAAAASSNAEPLTPANNDRTNPAKRGYTQYADNKNNKNGLQVHV